MNEPASHAGNDTVSDVLRVASGVGALVVALAAASLALSGAGNSGDSAAVAAAGLPPLLWAAWRPSWLSGIAGSVGIAVTLPSTLVGVLLVPVVVGAALTLCWKRARQALGGSSAGQ